MNEEVYSYIVSSIDLLNKSIKAQDNKTVHLFSYIYNNQMNINEQLKNYVTNQDIQLLSYCIINLDQRLQKVETRIGKMDKKIDKMITHLNNKAENEKNKIVIEQEKPNKIKIWWNNIKEFFKSIYNKCYQIIFKKKIQRELEEQRQREIEEEKKKIQEKQKIIKNILTRK